MLKATASLKENFEHGVHKKLTKEQKNQLVVQYAPLIKFIAYKIAMRFPANIELDDLISSGSIGLMDAIDKYDATRDNKFKTYAEFRIRGAILDELRAQDWVPRSIRDKTKTLNRVITKMKSRLGYTPKPEEIAEELKISMKDFHSLVNQVRPVSVLNVDESAAFSNVDKKSLLELIKGCKHNNPLMELSTKSVKDVITSAIEELPERQRLVLSLYYYEELNLKEIGHILRVTDSRVSQLHAQAIARLKNKLSNYFSEATAS